MALVAAECLARVAFDFPLYDADNKVGYWLRARQNGAFLFRNDWVFNRLGLGVEEEFRPSDKLDVLLVGDSLVYGGNELQQAEKLGPLLQRQTGWAVWPASAGSWALQNELAFLRRHSDLVTGSDVIVFVLNSGDFKTPSEWRSAYTHPRERPLFYLGYLVRRYLMRESEPPQSPSPVPRANIAPWWRNFVAQAGKPVIAIAYSAQHEAEQQCGWVPRHLLSSGSWYCYDANLLLGPDGFRDGVHPSVGGNQVLARIIADAIGAARSIAPPG